jgi:hypothetical protein
LLFVCQEVLKSLDLQVKQEQKQAFVSKLFEPQNAEKSFEREKL